MTPTSAELEDLTSCVASVLEGGALATDGRPVAVVPRSIELQGVVLPLLEWCRQREPQTPRGIVGLAAPCGAGKTLLLSWLAATSHALGWNEFGFVSLDGYHLPDAELRTLQGVDPSGKIVSLWDLKGTPATFDGEGFLEDLRRLKSNRDERWLPAYNRELHEAVAATLCISSEVKWVFVEGNFLFLDEIPWREIRELLDRKIYLDASDSVLKQRLRARHAAAGRGAAWIKAHFRRTDGPNILLIRSHAHFAEECYRWDVNGFLRKA